jgi:membrane associated rhomboid family serine protease
MMTDETKAGIVAGFWVAYNLVCCAVGGATGAVMLIAGVLLLVVIGVKDVQLDKERQRRRSYEEDCERRYREECGR